MRATKRDDFNDGKKTSKIQGMHNDTMQGMFDSKNNKAESMQNKLINTLEQNKERYNRGLYADWILRVYDKCSLACLHSRKSKIIKDTLRQEAHDLELTGQLEAYEKQCGKNCIRKYDKVYRLFESQETNVLRAFCEEQGIDGKEFIQAAQRETSSDMEKDLTEGLENFKKEISK